VNVHLDGDARVASVLNVLPVLPLLVVWLRASRVAMARSLPRARRVSNVLGAPSQPQTTSHAASVPLERQSMLLKPRVKRRRATRDTCCTRANVNDAHLATVVTRASVSNVTQASSLLVALPVAPSVHVVASVSLERLHVCRVPRHLPTRHNVHMIVMLVAT